MTLRELQDARSKKRLIGYRSATGTKFVRVMGTNTQAMTVTCTVVRENGINYRIVVPFRENLFFDPRHKDCR
jgi:hypothetical protein